MWLTQQQNVINLLYLHNVYRNHNRSSIFKKWHSLRKNQHNNKLLEIIKIICSLDILQQTCEVWRKTLATLGIGHTHLTHLHLISPGPLFPPSCLQCTVSKTISRSNTFFHIPHSNLPKPNSRYRLPSLKYSKITPLLPPSSCNFWNLSFLPPHLPSTTNRRANNSSSWIAR